MKRAYVLLSGGIDSTTTLHLAARDWPEVVGISVFYGQRHSKEIGAAATSCHRLGVRHTALDLSAVVPKTMLTDPTAKIPDIPYLEIEGISPTYVPFRNGLLLSAAVSFIQGERSEYRYYPDLSKEWGLYFGAHAEDAQNWAYSDCTFEFTGAMANAIYVGTYHQLRLHVPLQSMVKHEIIALGQSLGVKWEETWSCYRGGAEHCGVCPTCRSRREGFAKARVKDPTVYERAVA
jgi:7-cyano-7-deazaguanine synthase